MLVIVTEKCEMSEEREEMVADCVMNSGCYVLGGILL